MAHRDLGPILRLQQRRVAEQSRVDGDCVVQDGPQGLAVTRTPIGGSSWPRAAFAVALKAALEPLTCPLLQALSSAMISTEHKRACLIRSRSSWPLSPMGEPSCRSVSLFPPLRPAPSPCMSLSLSPGAANAQANVWKECGAQYQAAKAANELNGQSWRDFLKACRVRLAERSAPAATPGSSDATNARANILKECGAQYQVAKAANELKGQSWLDFLKACRARVAEQPAPAEAGATVSPPASVPAAELTIAPPPAPAPAPIAAPAAAPAPTISESGAETAPPAPTPTTHSDAAPAKPASEGLVAEKSRQKKCAAQWKAQKAELKKTNPTLKWPQYWSECNKRLKVSGQ